MSDDQPPLVPPGPGPAPAAPGPGPDPEPGSGPHPGPGTTPRWGAAPPPYAGAAGPQPPHPQAYPPAAYAGAPGRPLHKPGTIPLRPLTLVDFFDGAFTTVRRNPRATIGMGAMVTAGFMLIPIIGSIVVGLLGGLDNALTPDVTGTGSATGNTGLAVVYGASSISSVFGLLANVVVTGLVVPVVTRAAVGEIVSTGESWRQVRRRLPALLGLALLELFLALVVIVLAAGAGAGLGYAIGGEVGAIVLGILLGLAGLVGALAIHVKWFQLAAPNLVIEKRGVLAAISRAGRLSGGSFWRILGITLLASLLTGVVSQVIGFPAGVLGGVAGVALPDPLGSILLLVISNLATIVSGAVVAPFAGTIAVLQYLDQRFRREGFDIDLITYVQGRRTS